MSRFDDLSLLVREAYAVHVIFDAAGIPAAQIFVQQALSPVTGTVQVGVRAVQGDLDFTVVVGAPSGSMKDFRAEWLAALAIIREASSDELSAFVDGAHIRKHVIEIVTGMAMKGFRIAPPSQSIGLPN